MNRDLLDDAVRNMLAAELDVEVGLSDTPSTGPTVPYIIVFQSPSPKPKGDYAHPESIKDMRYLIKSVGRNHKETARTSSRAALAMTGPGGDWESAPAIVAVGFSIIERCLVSSGAIVRAEGPSLFETNDIYKIEVE